MKVIFLDFDGVINNWEYFEGVDYNNVKYLLEIIKSTGAKVVATSSKKYCFQKNLEIPYENTSFYKDIKTLKEYGINISDITPYIDGNRWLEINEYLKIHSEI